MRAGVRTVSKQFFGLRFELGIVWLLSRRDLRSQTGDLKEKREQNDSGEAQAGGEEQTCIPERPSNI